MKTIEDVRQDLDRVNERINTASGMAIGSSRQDIARVLLEAGEVVDAAIDDLSEIDNAAPLSTPWCGVCDRPGHTSDGHASMDMPPEGATK